MSLHRETQADLLKMADSILEKYRNASSGVDMGNLYFAASEYQKVFKARQSVIIGPKTEEIEAASNAYMCQEYKLSSDMDHYGIDRAFMAGALWVLAREPGEKK